jgi:putative SOS response-associated peptidase YedK
MVVVSCYLPRTGWCLEREFRKWETEGTFEYSCTELTINADEHSLMNRSHKPGDEKRALVIVPRAEWNDWLERGDPEYARTFMRLYPSELMTSWPAPLPPRAKKTDETASLF